MIVKEVQCRTCLGKSDLSDYVINPYVGCSHACTYCYATFIKKFQEIEDPWGEFVYARINSPDVLRVELKKKKPGSIWLSSVTDPYLPEEKEFCLTRRILETIQKSPFRIKFTLSVLTKSNLVLRDLDLLTDLGAAVGCSINCLDPALSRIIEPRAASPAERLAVLHAAKDAGLRTFVFFSPVLPGITDIGALFEAASFCDSAGLELLNGKSAVLERIIPCLAEHLPEQHEALQKRLRQRSLWFEETKREVAAAQAKTKLRLTHFVSHNRR